MQWLKLDVKTVPVPMPVTTSTPANIESNGCEKAATPTVSNNENDAMSTKVLFTRPVLLPLSIGLVLLIIQQVSGIDAIIFFTVEIFRASGNK